MQDIILFLEEELHHSFAEAESWTLREETFLACPPLQGGWSPIQVLEHITLTNHFLLILIEKGVRKSLAHYHTKGLETMTLNDLTTLNDVSDPNAFTWIRPEHMEPKGIPLAEIEAKMAEQKAYCLQLLAQIPNGEGTIHKTTMTVNGIGKINVYQYMYFLVLHIKRHLIQLQKLERSYFIPHPVPLPKGEGD